MLLSIFFIFYVVIIGSILMAGLANKRYTEGDTTVSLDDVTVIIPYRNEVRNIPGLIDSLKSQTQLPAKIIFVNDHSEDQGEEIIKGWSHERVTSISLANVEGKKRAIEQGIGMVTTKYVLTLDADIELPQTYFEELAKLSDADMWILPVRMTGKNLVQLFAITDVVLVNAINSGVANLFRPVLASGANLLFKTEKYKRYCGDENLSVSSGDDLFLLSDFRNSNQEIRVSNSRKLAVTTDAPKSLGEMTNQRVRWISKTRKVKDILASTLVLIQLLLTACWVVLIAYFLIADQISLAAITLVLKIVIDALLLLPYFGKSKSIVAWILLPFYEVVYPIYAILILTVSLGYKPKWKGRRISVK